MSFADRIAAIISEHGESLTYTRVLSVSRSASTLARSETTNTYTISAAIRRFKDKELGGLVQEGDREVRIAAGNLPFTPNANDKIKINDIDCNIISVDKRTDKGTPLVYILQVRGQYA